MRYPNGFPGWIDLSTTDQAVATSFYCDLFGWRAQDVPTDVGTTYTLLSLGDRLVAGIGPLPEEQAKAGAPSSWITYAMVGDVDEMVTAAPGAGGTVVVPAFDVMTSGRMAVLADPSGAMICLWQPREHQGADVFNEAGAFAWAELQSRDIAAALPFYEELFAWRWEKSSASAEPYLVAHLDAKGEGAEGVDTSIGGAMAMPPGVPEDVPSAWQVYFAVEVCDETVAAATDLGATLVAGPQDMDIGRWAALADPTGATFYVMSTAS